MLQLPALWWTLQERTLISFVRRHCSLCIYLMSSWHHCTWRDLPSYHSPYLHTGSDQTWRVVNFSYLHVPTCTFRNDMESSFNGEGLQVGFGWTHWSTTCMKHRQHITYSAIFRYRLSAIILTYRPSAIILTYRPSAVILTYRLSAIVLMYRLSAVILTYRLSAVILTHKLSAVILRYRLSAGYIYMY